jgi:cyclopropane fatty-acyl-phospholipid synthase-like methyltransferase
MVLPETERDELRDRLTLDRFPRSAGYDPAWMVDGNMGPNPVWLLEWLTDRMTLKPGMRVLDLGCGKARTSVFLAKEFGVDVVAADLWITPHENWPVIVEAGCADRILPLHAEAHDLKFAHDYFDAVVSVDAYQYFGTDALYVEYVSRFLRPGGQLGVIMPALTEEIDDIPDHLKPHWDWDFAAFHSAQWWRRLWARTGKVNVHTADDDPDGWRHWLVWDEACAAAHEEEWFRDMSAKNHAMIALDAGKVLTFCRLVASKPGTAE